MLSAFSAKWPHLDMEPAMQGLKRGGLLNQCLEEDDTYRQGRHHVMAAINQILALNIALEQVTVCFETLNLSPSLIPLHAATYIVPVGAAYLSSCQIKVFHISEAANFVQEQLGKISLLVTAIATTILFMLGQQLLAVTTLGYLAVGLLDRGNIFSEDTQYKLRQANFVIANLAGLYFGGNFIRVMCVTNMIIAAVQNYFKMRRESEEKATIPLMQNRMEKEAIEEENKPSISFSELQSLSNDSMCPVNRSHVSKSLLPTVRDDVKINDILSLSEQIDWDLHVKVIERKLSNDKRWLEIGQFKSTPLDHFKDNLVSMIESIRDRKILQGKPQNYEMLEYYCRYIAQELMNQDEISQADILIRLGVEGGQYCGTGKFEVVEEIFHGMCMEDLNLPLEARIFACEQQERVQVWQNIYQMTWRTNPFWQIQGYFTDINAVHNVNLFSNLIQAGEKFGIPHQSAQNDQTALINPFTHYLAFSIVRWIEASFWEGKPIPQCYVTIEKIQSFDRLKPWKWIKLHIDSVSPPAYNQKAILRRLQQTIGTAQISKSDIYSWWNDWIDRQEDLSEDERNKLSEELLMCASINGEPLEINNKIQDKFLLAMLIEMGALEKPSTRPENL